MISNLNPPQFNIYDMSYIGLISLTGILYVFEVMGMLHTLMVMAIVMMTTTGM